MVAKARVTITLDPDIWDRTRAAVEPLPRVSASSLIEDLLAEALPAIEAAAAIAEGTPRSDARRAYAETIGETFMRMMGGLPEEGDEDP